MFQWLQTLFRSNDVANNIVNAELRQIRLLGGNPDQIPVTRETCFGLPAFMRAVDLIASTCGRVPTLTYKRNPDGSKERATTHRLYQVLKRRPNAYQTDFDFKRQLVSDAIWSGNGYAKINEVRDETTGLVRLSLDILDPSKVDVVVARDLATNEPTQIIYYYNTGKQKIPYLWDQVIHVKGLNDADHAGMLGQRLIDVCKRSLGMAVSAVEFGNYYFENNCIIDKYIQLPIGQSMNKEQQLEFKETWEKAYSAPKRAFVPPILRGGAELKSVPLNAEEAAWIGSREMSQIDIANIVGVPPHTVGAKGYTSYNSLEQENLSLINHTLDKWFTNLEREFENKLLTEQEKREDSVFVEFLREKLLAADTATTNQIVIDLVNNGIITPDHGATILNQPVREDEYGSLYRRPANLVVENDPQAPAPAPPPQAEQEDVKTETGEDESTLQQTVQFADDRLDRLTQTTLDRLITRLSKASEKEGFTVEDHLDVFMENLAAFERAEAVIVPFLDHLEKTIQRDGRESAFNSVNTKALTEALCKR